MKINKNIERVGVAVAMCDKGNTNSMEMDAGATTTNTKSDWQKLSCEVLPVKRTRSPESPKSQRLSKKMHSSKKKESSDSNSSSSSSESETDHSEEGEVKKFIFPKKTAKPSLMKNSTQEDKMPKSSNRFASLQLRAATKLNLPLKLAMTSRRR